MGINKIKQGDSSGIALAPEEDASTGTTRIGVSGTKTATQAKSVSGTFSGKTYQTPWGNLATAIQVKNGKVVAVSIPTLPDSPPSIYAEPYLIDQALKSGGANIQSVSGATITSNAFKASLQSAIASAENSASSSSGTTSISTPSVDTAVYETPSSETSPTSPAVLAQTPVSATTVNASTITGSFTGNAYSTKWGNAVASVQIQNGKLVGVTMPSVPNSPPSIYAEPYLIEQAMQAGGSNIQGVSGATVTSIAFKSSLESALAKAGAKTTTTGTAAGAGTGTSIIQAITGSSNTTQTTKPSVPRSYRDDDDEDDDWDDDHDEEDNDNWDDDDD